MTICLRNREGERVSRARSSLGELVSQNKYLWKHESGVNEVAGGSVNPLVAAFDTGIDSSITTPYISQAAFNPKAPQQGVDRFLELQAIEPDFVMPNPQGQMQVRINTIRSFLIFF